MKIVFGNPKNVALDISIERTIEQWVYGRFQLWLGGIAIGSQADQGVDLKGCINWLSDFVVSPRNRCAPELMLAPKDIIWRETVDSVFESTDENAQYPDSFSRFHISHLGMSAFDTVILVLINDGEERERYIWQYNEKTIQDYTAPLGSLEACAKEAVSWFRELNK